VKVLFVVPFPIGKAASQRFRVEQYLPYLREYNVNYKLSSFWDDSTWEILYKDGNAIRKALGALNGFIRRVSLLTQVSNFNYVFIHREATPIGPPWFEWVASKVLKKKVIYDFDDAIWLNNTSEENLLATHLKWPEKTGSICKWSYKVSTGNSYLAEYAGKFNELVFVLPSVVDTENHFNQLREYSSGKVTIGWIGSHSTLPYLKLIEPILQQLELKYNFDFIVIADKKPNLKLQSVIFLPWSADIEVENILRFNIGVMPLPNTEWARGKCAFKAIQYMALGIPAVVSAVGANTEVIEDKINGFTCSTPEEWYNNLEQLILNSELRQQLGLAGRAQISSKYSLTAQKQAFVNLFA
jgi:glycosyltransferase involved in cell wall biosynthesis